jgi:hypothetical protein
MTGQVATVSWAYSAGRALKALQTITKRASIGEPTLGSVRKAFVVTVNGALLNHH